MCIILCLNKIGDEGATAIAEALKVNAVLTHLNLENNRSISDKGKKQLRDAVQGRAGFKLAV